MTQAERPFVVSIAETCRLLGVSRATVYRMLDKGLLIRVPMPVHWMVLYQSIVDYILSVSGSLPKKPAASSSGRSRR